jgi:hypothetical protein
VRAPISFLFLNSWHPNRHDPGHEPFPTLTYLSSSFLLLSILLLAILDCQAPNIQIIANADNHIDDETRVDSHGEAQACEHEGDLVDSVAEGAGPAEAELGTEERAEGVDDAVDQREDEDVLVGEG